MMETSSLVSKLDQEIVPAVGCTEPVAIALTSAAAMKAVSGKLRLLELVTSMNIFKNARAAGIPGCVDTGIELAAALGAAIARLEAGLEIFSYVDSEIRKAAGFMLETAKFRTDVDMDRNDIYVRCRIVTDVGEAIAETVRRHQNVHLVSLNGKDVPRDMEHNGDERPLLRQEASFRELVEAVYDAPCGAFILIPRSMSTWKWLI